MFLNTPGIYPVIFEICVKNIRYVFLIFLLIFYATKHLSHKLSTVENDKVSKVTY